MDLKGEVVRLQRELETERTARANESAAHAKEIKKIKQANDKVSVIRRIIFLFQSSTC